jgi:hypothetical protein
MLRNGRAGRFLRQVRATVIGSAAERAGVWRRCQVGYARSCSARAQAVGTPSASMVTSITLGLQHTGQSSV